MTEARHLIFDLDGTLIDSKYEIVETCKKVFAKIPPLRHINVNDLNYGAALVSILDLVYEGNEGKILAAKKLFASVYDNSTFNNTLLYPGVIEVLSELTKNGFILHIATNKRLTPTIKILEYKNILPFFKSIKTSDFIEGEVLSKEQIVKEVLKENNVLSGVVIGDSIQDVEAAVSLNLTAIAALYGYEKNDNLLKKRTKFAINNFKELIAILKVTKI